MEKFKLTFKSRTREMMDLAASRNNQNEYATSRADETKSIDEDEIDIDQQNNSETSTDRSSSLTSEQMKLADETENLILFGRTDDPDIMLEGPSNIIYETNDVETHYHVLENAEFTYDITRNMDADEQTDTIQGHTNKPEIMLEGLPSIIVETNNAVSESYYDDLTNVQDETREDVMRNMDADEQTETIQVDDINNVGSGGRRKLKAKEKKIERRLCREKGKEYINRKGKTILARRVKPSCGNTCLKKCISKIDNDLREKIHENFWVLDSNQKKDFLLRFVNKSKKERETVTGKSRRVFTRKYFLPFGDDRVEVCKLFFMNTLDVGAKLIRYTEEHASSIGIATCDRRGLTTPANKTAPHTLKAVRNYIESLPAVPSHYCRNSSAKKYLPQNFESLTNVYRLYIKHCQTNGMKEVSESVFKKIFRTEYNIGIHTPKKDKCSQCVTYTSLQNPSSSQQDDQDKHKQEENDIAKRYKEDQERSKKDDNNFITVSFDLEKVLNTPHGNSILFFYARKYAMYNLTFYESGTRQTYCYMWGESDGRRGCTEICTIMWKYLMLLDNRGVKEVALYCDNCAGQQKNHAMFVLLSEFIKQARSLKKIGLNFLMVGHSMMTVDSVHGVIERTVAKKTVFAPSEWATIVTNARVNPFPYEVVKMKRNEFRDWREYSKKFKIENERGEKLQISTVQRAYWSKSEVMGKIDIFKNAADKVSTIYLCQQVRRRKGVKRNNYYDLTEAPFAYPQELNLSSQKYKDLINLCNKGAIPERYHAEYFSLPHSETVPDVLNETDEEDLE